MAPYRADNPEVAGISGAPSSFTPKFQLDGAFRVALPPGMYEVVVERAGSAVRRFPGAKAAAGAAVTVDAPLRKGDRQE